MKKISLENIYQSFLIINIFFNLTKTKVQYVHNLHFEKNVNSNKKFSNYCGQTTRHTHNCAVLRNRHCAVSALELEIFQGVSRIFRNFLVEPGSVKV